MCYKSFIAGSDMWLSNSQSSIGLDHKKIKQLSVDGTIKAIFINRGAVHSGLSETTFCKCHISLHGIMNTFWSSNSLFYFCTSQSGQWCSGTSMFKKVAKTRSTLKPPLTEMIYVWNGTCKRLQVPESVKVNQGPLLYQILALAVGSITSEHDEEVNFPILLRAIAIL